MSRFISLHISALGQNFSNMRKEKNHPESQIASLKTHIQAPQLCRYMDVRLICEQGRLEDKNTIHGLLLSRLECLDSSLLNHHDQKNKTPQFKQYEARKCFKIFFV